MIIDLYLSLQVRKIAAVFRLQPSILYLAEEFDNIVIFPHEQSGRFNKQQIDSRCSYEVHGDEVVAPTSHGAPFWWLYWSFPSACNSFNVTSPPSSNFSSSRPEKEYFSQKPSSKSPGLNYTVVTQVVVTLEANNCSSGVVADLVKQQVG